LFLPGLHEVGCAGVKSGYIAALPSCVRAGLMTVALI
jgi:hypothetical protein